MGGKVGRLLTSSCSVWQVAGFLQDQRSIFLKCCCLRHTSTDIQLYFMHPLPKHRLKICLSRVHRHRKTGQQLSYLFTNLLRYIMDDAEGQDKIKNRKAIAHKLMSIPPPKHATNRRRMVFHSKTGVFSWTLFVLLLFFFPPVHWYRVGRVKGTVPLK